VCEEFYDTLVMNQIGKRSPNYFAYLSIL